VCFKLNPEKTQSPEELVKYLQKVCCHPGNSRETQITAACWGLAHAYRAALFNTAQILKGERRGSEAAGTATGTAPPVSPAAPPPQQAVTDPPTSTMAATATITGAAPICPAGTAAAPAPAPAAGITAQPDDQPVLAAVAPVKLKKDANRANLFSRDDNEPGMSLDVQREGPLYSSCHRCYVE